jgi:hypothetical protein
MLVLGVIGLGMSRRLTFIAKFFFSIPIIIGRVGRILCELCHKRRHFGSSHAE